MNKARKERLSRVITILETVQNTIDNILAEENEAKDAIARHFAGTDGFGVMEENASILETASSDLDIIIGSLEDVG